MGKIVVVRFFFCRVNNLSPRKSDSSQSNSANSSSICNDLVMKNYVELE